MKAKLYHAMIEWFRQQSTKNYDYVKVLTPQNVALDGTYNLEALAEHLEEVIRGGEESE